MNFTLFKFRNLRDKLTSKIARYETDLLDLLTERKELVKQFDYNKALELSYSKELRLISCGTVWDYMTQDLDQDTLNIQEFVWGLEEDLEELDSEIEAIQYDMEDAIRMFGDN